MKKGSTKKAHRWCCSAGRFALTFRNMRPHPAFRRKPKAAADLPSTFSSDYVRTWKHRD